MTLPEQHPEPAPRYRFRPRNDRYTAFRAPMTPRVVEQPWERFPENEPRPFDWSELTPGTFVGGLLMFLGIVAFVVFAGIVW